MTDEIFYLSAIEESDFVIAQASAQLNDQGELIEELVPVRHLNEFAVMPPERVDYMDVSPRQPTCFRKLFDPGGSAKPAGSNVLSKTC